ncbi:multiple epidermal growth factor-like domains 10 [Plakobranchus ocellatus]|uniref:Multiple epidermal growth factor-like domains 10 n=1 Tax=Plakobranchus ocellatus TaxID=259542 RepID=A0AAV4BDA6_9GAST|nr:multiple epidermal growth factor-like domains 10 [Plakobranchus ocellatus]
MKEGKHKRSTFFLLIFKIYFKSFLENVLLAHTDLAVYRSVVITAVGQITLVTRFMVSVSLGATQGTRLYNVTLVSIGEAVLTLFHAFQKCPREKYGSNCEKTCSVHCAGLYNTCDWTDGSCDQGCDPGYLSPLCTEACPRDRYGDGCNETCSEHCAGEDKICNHRDGSCILGCEKGYVPPNCNEVSQENEEASGSAVSLGSIIGGVIAAAVVAAAVVIGALCWRRQKASRNHPNTSQSPRESAVVFNRRLPSPPRPPNGSSLNMNEILSAEAHNNQSFNIIYLEDSNIGNHDYVSVLDHYDRPASLARDSQGYDIPLPRLQASVDSV